MIVYGSALADGNAHQHHNLPTVLAGRGPRHAFDPAATSAIRTRRRSPTCISRCSTRMGVPVEQFGDSNGKLMELSDL